MRRLWSLIIGPSALVRPLARRTPTAAALGTVLIAVSLSPTFAQRGAPTVPAPVPAVLRDYRPVTAERLRNPEDGNCLMIRRTCDGWGFSRQTQITPDNVSRLGSLE